MDKTIVNGWEKKINYALKTGRGKFGGFTPICDLFDYKKMISLIRQNKLNKAFEFADNLDTNAREGIPMTIWHALEKEFYHDV